MKKRIKYERERRSPKKAIIVIAIILVLLAAAAVTAGVYVNSKLDLIDYETYENGWECVSYTEPESETDEFEVDKTAEVVIPKEEIYKDKDVFNILLLGTDERRDKFSNGSRADSIMVLSINKKTDTIKLVSIERGILVRMPDGNKDILTHVFHYGGPNWMMETVRTHFNLDVDRYIRVNFNVFEKIVDSVGGVDIELTKKETRAMNHEIPTNTFPLDRKVKVGMNHLNGFEALQYCRLRWTDSDWVRIKRQRRTIKAIQSQCKNLSLGEIDDALDTVLPMIQTNLEKDELLALAGSVSKFLDGEIVDMTIPADGTSEGTNHVDYEANRKILHEFFYGEVEG